MRIPFNKPIIAWFSLTHLIRAALSGTVAGNGPYTKRCHAFFEKRFGFAKVLLTTSCSDALEMTALLCRIGPGDEVIMPSFTFMSTANAFMIRGAKIVFADTLPDVPNIDPAEIERLITPKTKAIVVVHYSGLACDMDRIMDIASRHGLLVVEDAAHAIDSYYHEKPLGSIGHFGTFSFHETKNIISGEGGMLIINDKDFKHRAEIIWEKGTNRAAFYRGEIDKYGWVDIGSSYLPSDAVAAFLYSQILRFDRIQSSRKKVWWNYYELLKPLEQKGFLKCPVIPDFATVNGNIFFITVNSGETRDKLIEFLKENGISALFHYLPLHSSPYFIDKHDGRNLPNTDRFSATILRLPFYNTLRKSQVKFIVARISEFLQTT
jgi:dTDP-4-amino-4,6-dideoxygalactose transaminase